jgi:hypothetical protein
VTETIEDLICLARQKGPERKYLDWLRTQPSARSGRFSWSDGQPFCEPAHFRTARNSGIGQKPEYIALSLTHDEHQEQHRVGQFNFMPREWWEEKTRESLQRWLTS